MKSKIATNIEIIDAELKVSMQDGRILFVPIEWFPRLRNANKKQLENWRFIGDGEGVHWEDLDEDILVEKLF